MVLDNTAKPIHKSWLNRFVWEYKSSLANFAIILNILTHPSQSWTAYLSPFEMHAIKRAEDYWIKDTGNIMLTHWQYTGQRNKKNDIQQEYIKTTLVQIVFVNMLALKARTL